MRPKTLFLIASVALLALILTIIMIPTPSSEDAAPTEVGVPSITPSPSSPPHLLEPIRNQPTALPARTDPPPPDAIPNERIISFPSQKALEEFLSRAAGSHLKVIARSNFSHTLRVGIKDKRDLAALPNEAEVAYNFPVESPPIPDGAIHPNATPFQGRIKEWMGITGDNSQWGSGVSVAVIDSGLLPHSALGSEIQVLSVAGSPQNPDLDPHGTAMTSLWRDGEGRIPAIAPAVKLTSIQVSDDDGKASLFSLAEAIYLAVDSGAQLIPISMGATSTTPQLDRAIAYATDNGALIVASAGNSGTDTPFYPAAHPDTVSVGAIDYNRNHPGFSNTGDTIDLVAPGVGLVTAGMDDALFLNTGTSPAAQIAGNVIAATMSELEISDPFTAWEVVSGNLNELGISGSDNLFGGGYPQLDVILNHDQPGRMDAAIASTLIVSQPQSSEGEIQVVVSNPGTEPLRNATLQFDVAGQRFTSPVPDIAVGGTHDFTIPLPIPSNADTVTVTSQVTLPEGQQDVRPRDNSVKATFSIGK